MLTNSEDIGGEDGFQSGEVLPPFNEGQMGDRAIEVEDVEGKHVDIDFDLAELGGLAGTSRQHLKRQ